MPDKNLTGISNSEKEKNMQKLLNELEKIELMDAIDEMLEGDVNDIDVEAIQKHLARLQEIDPIEIVGSGEQAWEQFQHRHSMLLEIEEKPQAKPRRKSFRYIAVIAATLAVMFSGMMVAQAAGLDLLGALARWSNETFGYATMDNGGSDKSDEFYHIIQKELANNDIDDKIAPAWYPEGFEMDEPKVELSDVSDVFAFYFNNTEGQFLRISVERFEDASLLPITTLEKTEDAVQQIQLEDGKLFYIFENSESIRAICTEGNLVITISGNISMEQLKMIVNSIGG